MGAKKEKKKKKKTKVAAFCVSTPRSVTSKPRTRAVNVWPHFIAGLISGAQGSQASLYRQKVKFLRVHYMFKRVQYRSGKDLRRKRYDKDSNVGPLYPNAGHRPQTTDMTARANSISLQLFWIIGELYFTVVFLV